ncbi:MAG: DUF2062 domain-containing protein [Nitrospirae bacterium]|nr:DUF2062 domain-containing protein [Nitrospirota bacterium]
MALRDKLREVISTKDSPRKIALSFALGVFIGMSPLLGFHTVLGIGAASLFRMNRFVTVVGVFVTNPWTMVPIYTFSTWFGTKLLGVEDIIPPLQWHHISISYLLNELSFLLWPFVCGSTVVGVISAVIGYIVVYYAVVHQRNEAEKRTS